MLPLPAEPPPPASARRPLQALQIGGDWFTDRPGGAGRYYRDLLRHLPAAGVNCRGLVAGSARASSESGGVVEPFAECSAPLWSRWMGVRRETRKSLTAGPPDVVASHFALYALPVLSLARDVPRVVHFHGPWALESTTSSRSVKAWIERRVYHRAAACVVLSQAFGGVLSREYGVSENRVRVVPGGVDLARFTGLPDRAAARQSLGWPGDRLIVLAVRRLVRRMGLADLLTAAQKLRRRVPCVLVLIAGTGPLSDELRRQTAALGLEEFVRFLGQFPDEQLPAAYRAADLSIVPSVSLEGFGLAAAESLAAGTPVLVTPVGGLPEVVRDLSADLVLPSSGPGPIAEGLGDALTGRLPLPDASACRDYAARRFDWHRVADEVANIYREVVDGARV